MTWVQTVSGRAVSLLTPSPADIDFETDIPDALARIARFSGHIGSGPYSVAQHCVLGCEAMLREGQGELAATLFLLHDAKEAYLGDITTPVKMAMGEAGQAALKRLEGRLDAAIHIAAGMPWPVAEPLQRLIKQYDTRMLATERRLLLPPSPTPWGQEVESARLIALPRKLSVWPWPDAAEAWHAAMARLCPRIVRRRATA